MAKLVLKFKDMVRQEYPLLNPILGIGRSPTNDIHIDNLAVSRNHAQIVREGSHFFIEDLNSNNGTFVNGEQIQRHPLQDGDNIQIGKHVLQFFLKGGEELQALYNAGGSAEAEDFSDMEGTILTTPRMVNAARATAAAAAAAPPPPVAKQPAPVAVLTVLQGNLSRKKYELTASATTIGKGDVSEIRLSGFLVPGLAAVINRRPEGYFVTPSGGWIKPRLNGNKLTAQSKLNEGDVLEIRGFKFLFSGKEGQGG